MTSLETLIVPMSTRQVHRLDVGCGNSSSNLEQSLAEFLDGQYQSHGVHQFSIGVRSKQEQTRNKKAGRFWFFQTW
jgi:hypothetical protein